MRLPYGAAPCGAIACVFFQQNRAFRPVPDRKHMRLFHSAVLIMATFAGPCWGAALENLLQGNPQSQHVWRAAGERIAIPFEWHDGHMMVAVRVNGSAPLRLAFDSG